MTPKELTKWRKFAEDVDSHLDCDGYSEDEPHNCSGCAALQKRARLLLESLRDKDT